MITIISNKREFANIAKDCLVNLQTGKTYQFAFEEIKSNKTLKQLGFIFGGLISALQRYYKEADGVEYDKELIKELLYQELGVDEIIILPTGRKVVYKKSLSKMTKDEASEFINKCIVWIDESTDCILPIGLRYLWTTNISDEEVERYMNATYPEKDELYLAQLRRMHCLGCGDKATEAHHIRQGVYATSMKNADYMAIPICFKCHKTLHNLGERSFLNGIRNVTNGMEIETFCKIHYQKVRKGEI